MLTITEKKNKMRLIIMTLLISTLILGCDTTKMNETDIAQFEGSWKLEGRGIYEGIEMELKNTGKDDFVGTITKLNDNKYVKMFMEVGDKFVTSISRNSNYEFTLTEKKIASELFSMYGQSTTQNYIAVFENKDTINLDPSGTECHYVRIK